MLRISLFILFSLAGIAHAIEITGTSGTIGDGNTLTITGVDFSTSANSKPTFYFDGEDGDANPSATLGSESAWAEIVNMEYSSGDAFEGTGVLESTAGWRTDPGATCSVRANLGENEFGEKWFWSIVRRNTSTTITGSVNIKYDRIWTDSGVYPNFVGMGAPGAAGDEITTSEYSDGTRVDYHPATDLGFPSNAFIMPGKDTTDWIVTEWRFQVESSAGTEDAFLELTQNGTVMYSSATWSFTSSGSQDTLDHLRIQDDPANTIPTDGQAFYDMIYISTGTWARVYFSTHSTLSGAWRFPQPYSSWSDTSITITQKHGNIPAESTIYAYVCDNDNNCSAGYALSEGASPRMSGSATISGSLTIH